MSQGIEKWQADAYRKGDVVTLELSEGTELRGPIAGRLEKVGDRTFLLYPEKPIEVFYKDVIAVKNPRRPNESDGDGMAEISGEWRNHVRRVPRGFRDFGEEITALDAAR